MRPCFARARQALLGGALLAVAGAAQPAVYDLAFHIGSTESVVGTATFGPAGFIGLALDVSSTVLPPGSLADLTVVKDQGADLTGWFPFVRQTRCSPTAVPWQPWGLVPCFEVRYDWTISDAYQEPSVTFRLLRKGRDGGLEEYFTYSLEETLTFTERVEPPPVVPEPSTGGLLAAGLLVAAAAGTRRERR